MNNSTEGSLVSFVMRTIGGREREIRRAISSIASNSWPALEVVVVYQGVENEQWRDLQKLPDEFPLLMVSVLRNQATGDRRAENLNIGWERSRGRYIGFLDDDDTLEPNHVALLVDSLQKTGKTWAYAQVTLRTETDALEIISESQPFRRHAFSLKSLWTENFLPIHSFLIDRTTLHIDLQKRPFCEELDRSEDWDFLIRLAFYHEPVVVEQFTATYHVRTGAGNTNLSVMDVASDTAADQLNREAWARCKFLVEARKSTLVSSVWWATNFFSSPVKAAHQTQTTVAHRSLRERLIRRCIRLLERLL